AGSLIHAPSGALRVVVGGEAPGFSEAFATLTDDLAVVVAAVVLMDEQLERRRLGHVTRTASDRPGSVDLLCCGGHGLPPLCPSERSIVRKARRAGLTGRSIYNIAHSDVRTRNFGVTHHRRRAAL